MTDPTPTEFGPGRPYTEESGPAVTGTGPLLAPPPAQLLRSAAFFLDRCEGATLDMPDQPGPVVFRGGDFPHQLRRAADDLDAAADSLRDLRRQNDAARARRLRHIRPLAAVAYDLLGRGGNGANRLAAKLDNRFGFDEEDFER